MQYLSSDMAQIQVDEEAARRRQEQAQRLMQAGFNPVPNANPILSILASVMSTIKGDSMLKDSDAKLSETLAKRFEIQNQQDQAKAEAERKRRDEDYQRELDKIGYTKEVEAKYREPSKIDPLSAEGIAATLGLERAKAGMQPKAERAPSELERKIAWLEANGVGKDAIANMVMGGQSNAPSGYRQTSGGGLEAIPGGPADKPKEVDPKAAAAQQAREVLDSLEQQLSASGPIDGRLPTASAQGFDRAVAQLVNPFQTLTRIPGQGSQSDAELKRLMESFPAVTNYESVNKNSIANLRSYLDKIQGMQAQGGQVAPQAQPQAPQAPAQGQPTQTATNPQTGQKIGLINGQWVPI